VAAMLLSWSSDSASIIQTNPRLWLPFVGSEMLRYLRTRVLAKRDCAAVMAVDEGHIHTAM